MRGIALKGLPEPDEPSGAPDNRVTGLLNRASEILDAEGARNLFHGQSDWLAAEARRSIPATPPDRSYDGTICGSVNGLRLVDCPSMSPGQVIITADSIYAAPGEARWIREEIREGRWQGR